MSIEVRLKENLWPLFKNEVLQKFKDCQIEMYATNSIEQFKEII